MTDEKLIDEMAKDLNSSISVMTNDSFSDCLEIAKFLNNLGYRNCKNKVVLTEEEYEAEQRVTGYWKERAKMWKQAAHEVRKETAREIYRKAKAIVDATKVLVQGREYLHIDALKELIKQCGVEMEE